MGGCCLHWGRGLSRIRSHLENLTLWPFGCHLGYCIELCSWVNDHLRDAWGVTREAWNRFVFWLGEAGQAESTWTRSGIGLYCEAQGCRHPGWWWREFPAFVTSGRQRGRRRASILWQLLSWATKEEFLYYRGLLVEVLSVGLVTFLDFEILIFTFVSFRCVAPPCLVVLNFETQRARLCRLMYPLSFSSSTRKPRNLKTPLVPEVFGWNGTLAWLAGQDEQIAGVLSIYLAFSVTFVAKPNIDV